MKVGTLKRKLLSPSGKPRMDDKRFDIERENMKVSENYIESINNQTWNHGLYFEVDEEATKKHEEANKKLSAEIKQRRETERAMNAEKIATAAAASLSAFAEKKQPAKRGPKSKKVADASNES